MDFEALARWKEPIERRLRDDFRRERRLAGAIFSDYVGAIEEFTLRGGKRFRSLLVLAGYWIATGRDPTPVVPAAAALEQFQSWMLIHDDVIDHAETRRDGPSMHRAFERRFAAAGVDGSAADLGVGIGITLGDLEEPLTVRGLLAADAPAPRRLAALEEYVRMTRETAYGQILDIQNGARPVEEVTEKDVLTVHRLKSAVYTVASPLRIGAMLGGAPPSLLADLETFGIDAGIAFQLRDDVLGAGLAADPGKSANDLVEGKRTLLVVRAWADGSPADRDTLRRVLGRPSATASDVDAAREVLRSTGSLAYSERRIAALGKRVDRKVRTSRAWRAAARPLLAGVADRLLYRAN